MSIGVFFMPYPHRPHDANRSTSPIKSNEKASAGIATEAFWYVSERKLLPYYKLIGIHFNTIVNQAEGIDTAGIRLQVDAIQFR